MESEVDSLVRKLTNILRNLKKSPNRRFLKQTLISKAQESRNIYNRLLELLEDHSGGQLFLSAIRNTFSEIKIFIDSRLEVGPHLFKFKNIALTVLAAVKIKNSNKMANIVEIIKVASNLIPTYDGNAGKLSSITAALRALDTVINDATRASAINVVLSKLEGKARSAVGDAPETINAIIRGLEDRCKSTDGPDVILAKLQVLRQTGTLTNFTDEVEKLANQLETLYIADNVPIDTAKRLATKAAVKSLTNGIKNTETKLILKAGQFQTISAAITKAAENDSNEVPNNHNIFHMRSHANMRGRRHGSYDRRGNHSNRGNNHHRGNNRYHNYTNRQPNETRYRGNSNFGRGFHSFPRHDNRNIYSMNADQAQNAYNAQNQPQQMTHGTMPSPNNVNTTPFLHQQQQQGNFPLGVPLGTRGSSR